MTLPAFAAAAMLVATLAPAMAASQADTALPRITGEDVSKNEQLNPWPGWLNPGHWHNWRDFTGLPVAGYIGDTYGNYLAARSTDAEGPDTRLLTFSPMESEAILFILTPALYEGNPKDGFTLTVAYNGESPKETKGWTVSFPPKDDSDPGERHCTPLIATADTDRALLFDADLGHGFAFLFVVGSSTNNANYRKTALEFDPNGFRDDGSIMPCYYLKSADYYADYNVPLYEELVFVPIGEGPLVDV